MTELETLAGERGDQSEVSVGVGSQRLAGQREAAHRHTGQTISSWNNVIFWPVLIIIKSFTFIYIDITRQARLPDNKE